MSDRERAKEWLNEMSSDNLDRILYFMNLVLAKKELITENCNLKNEKQQLISFLKHLIEETECAYKYMENDYKDSGKWNLLNEILDFVTKGGKDE